MRRRDALIWMSASVAALAVTTGCGSRGDVASLPSRPGDTARPGSPADAPTTAGAQTSPAPGGTTGPNAPSAPGGVPVGPPVPPPATGKPAVASMQALLAERKFLQEWFNGTPVMIEMDGESALRVEVPLQFAFGPRSADVTKALQKVVDNVSQSLRRVPAAMYEISAPPDAGSSDLQLATRRAEAVRAAITRRAVLPQRAGAVIGVPSGNVLVRLVMPPAT